MINSNLSAFTKQERYPLLAVLKLYILFFANMFSFLGKFRHLIIKYFLINCIKFDISNIVSYTKIFGNNQKHASPRLPIHYGQFHYSRLM